MKTDRITRNTRLAGGTIMFLFIGLIYAWSIFRAPLIELFPGWTPTKISMTFTISMIFFSAAIFVSGQLALKISGQKIIRIAALIILVGFALLTFLLNPEAEDRSLYILYIFYGVFCGTGVGLTYNAILSSITKWYPGRTGTATGVMMLGFGVGGIVLGSIVSFMVGRLGIIPVFLILGIILAAIMLSLSFLIKVPEPDKPDIINLNDTDERPPGPECIRNYTLSEMLKTSSFWVYFLWTTTIATGGLLVVNIAANIAVFFGAPAVLGLVVSMFNGVGRFSLGVVFDWVGRAKAIYIDNTFMLLGGLALMLGAVTGHVALIFIGLPLVGIAFGGGPTISSAVIMKFFGPKNFSANFGAVSFAVLPASIIGPLVSSRLQELSGGEYFTTFIMLVIIGLASMLINYIVGVISKKAGLE